MKKNIFLIVKIAVLSFIYLYVIFALSGVGFDLLSWDLELYCIIAVAWFIITFAFSAGYYQKPIEEGKPQKILIHKGNNDESNQCMSEIPKGKYEVQGLKCPKCGKLTLFHLSGDDYLCVNCSKKKNNE